MGRPQRHPRHRRREVPDPQRARPHLTRPGAPDVSPGADPEPEHLAPPGGLRDREPRGRPRRRDHRADAVAGSLGGPGRPRHRLRHRLPPPAVRRDRPLGHRRRAARRPRRDRAASGTPARRTSRVLPGLGRPRSRCPTASVDVVHARWAYFFGPGCEPGLAELDRVMRPGGRAFVIDNDPTRSTFGGWFRRGYPDVDPDAVARVLGGRRAGSGTRSTSPGPSTRARTSRPSYASSSPPTWPRRSWPGTRAPRSTTRSTCGAGTLLRLRSGSGQRAAGAAYDEVGLRASGPVADGLWASTMCRIRTSSTATCSSGWRTEVRPGQVTWAASESSKPTTPMSRRAAGRAPRRRAARRCRGCRWRTRSR